MNMAQHFAFLVFAVFSLNVFAADLVTFSDGDVISATDVNANFQSLDNEVTTSPNVIRIGDQAIVTGSFTVSGQGTETVVFPVQFATAPVITHSIVSSAAEDTWLEGRSKTATSTDIEYRGVTYSQDGSQTFPAQITVDYIAIGTVAP